MFTGIKKTYGFISSRTVSGGACIRLHRAVQSVLICLGGGRPASQQLFGSHRSSSCRSGWIRSSALADWSHTRVTVVRLYHVFILSFYGQVISFVYLILLWLGQIISLSYPPVLRLDHQLMVSSCGQVRSLVYLILLQLGQIRSLFILTSRVGWIDFKTRT